MTRAEVHRLVRQSLAAFAAVVALSAGMAGVATGADGLATGPAGVAHDAVGRVTPQQLKGATARDGHWIAYATKTGIYKVHPDGTGNSAVVSRWGARYPSWSPNGRWILYGQVSHDSVRNAKSYIALVRPNGTQKRRLTRGWSPEWLPGGRRILFHKGVLSSTPTPIPLYVYHLRTGHVTRLNLPHFDTDNNYNNGDGVSSDYAISRDGRQIAWISFCDTPYTKSCPEYHNYLDVMNLDGTNYRHYSTGTDEIALPSWTPDGNVAYTCQAPTKNWNLDTCIRNLKTGNVTYFSKPRRWQFEEQQAVWSPSGRHVIIEAINGFYTVNSRYRHFHLLWKVYTPSANPTHPSWQPLVEHR